MSDIYNSLFHEPPVEELLCLRMPELVTLRAEAINDSTMKTYEELYVIDGMKDAVGLFEAYPSLDFVYTQKLNRVAEICRTMEYKTVLFYRYINAERFQSNDFLREKAAIISSIKYNPFISFTNLIKRDASLDIETELEHLIETGQLQSISQGKTTKYGYRKWIINPNLQV